MTDTQLFFRRMLIFLEIPIIVGFVIALFSPIDWFNFRSWEALLPAVISVEGSFYPSQYLEKIEVGDLGVRTDYAIDKYVEFYTDNYGFRYDGAPDTLIDIVIVGDSFTVGSALTQGDTIANQLGARLDRTVYPYAPASLTQYMQDARFVDNPPQYVLLQVVERNLGRNLCTASNLPVARPPSEISSQWLNSLIRIDIVLRTPVYAYGYFTSLRSETQVIANQETQMLFFDNSLNPPNIDIEALRTQLLNCQQWLEERGSQLIFMPIPDKETVYFDDIPQSHRPDMSFAERRQAIVDVIISTREMGILTVDFLTASETAYNNGQRLYQLDDTHWNADGVTLAVDLVQELLETEIGVNNGNSE